MPVEYVYGEEYTLTATIETVKEGVGKIRGGGLVSTSDIELGVAQTETLLREDFFAKYPSANFTTQ